MYVWVDNYPTQMDCRFSEALVTLTQLLCDLPRVILTRVVARAIESGDGSRVLKIPDANLNKHTHCQYEKYECPKISTGFVSRNLLLSNSHRAMCILK